MTTPSLTSAEGHPPPLSRVVGGLPTNGPLTLADLLASFGARAHGGAILLLALPDALPLPVPSVSAILGLPLVLVSAHLAIAGESGVLPRRLGTLQIPRTVIAALVARLPPTLARMERLSRGRWRRLAGREHVLGAICLYLSVLLLAPLPFFNTPPALCLALIAWGMVQKDGAFVVAGLAGAALLTAALGAIGLFARSLLG